MKRNLLIGVLCLAGLPNASAQSAGEGVKLEYGTVVEAGKVEAENRHAGGALLGGVAGAAIADDHHGLGALAGGLIGGGIQGAATDDHMLEQYTVELKGGGSVVVDTEQHDIVVGDCVMVEKGQYVNIRRVSSVNCEVDQDPPEHHQQAASACDKAKSELGNAKTEDEANLAVIKIRTLCED